MNKISNVRMKQLLEKGAILVDMRSPIDYRNVHIDGAINLPLRNLTNKLMASPKNTVFILYSTSITDADLTQGKNYAEQLGFQKVFVSDYSTLNYSK